MYLLLFPLPPHSSVSKFITQVPDFSPSWAETFVALSMLGKWAKFFPRIYTFLEWTPRWILSRYAPGVILTLDHHDVPLLFLKSLSFYFHKR